VYIDPGRHFRTLLPVIVDIVKRPVQESLLYLLFHHSLLVPMIQKLPSLHILVDAASEDLQISLVKVACLHRRVCRPLWKTNFHRAVAVDISEPS
jgi:hypothetical protein